MSVSCLFMMCRIAVTRSNHQPTSSRLTDSLFRAPLLAQLPPVFAVYFSRTQSGQGESGPLLRTLILKVRHIYSESAFEAMHLISQ